MDQIAGHVAGTTAGEWDPAIEGFVIRRDGPWMISVSSALFNDRLTLTHEEDYPRQWSAGFCYDKGGAAALAAAVWNPLEQARPVGFKRVAAESFRFREHLAAQVNE